NKVVFIDLWATWCSPCLEAMQEFRSTKNEFYDKDVVFVYLTNGSSPLKLWNEKIKGIGSEHYYLKSSQWEFIMNDFGFKAIPSYLLYNKHGLLINKFTAFPGNNKTKEMINSLL
ncbi:MAG: TlpA family protein disulfide reductase, partial [Pedobacter sp.]